MHLKYIEPLDSKYTVLKSWSALVSCVGFAEPRIKKDNVCFKHSLLFAFSFSLLTEHHSTTGSAIITTIYVMSLPQFDDRAQPGHRSEAWAELLHTAG